MMNRKVWSKPLIEETRVKLAKSGGAEALADASQTTRKPPAS